MNSKLRVKETLNFKEADKIPVDYWADKIVTKKLMNRLNIQDIEQLYKYLGIDFRYIQGSVYKGPELQKYDDGSWTDIWGVIRKKILVGSNNPEKGSYEHVLKNPLTGAETVKDIESYQGWPSADWYDYSQVEDMADQYSSYSIVCGGDRLNRTAQLKTTIHHALWQYG